MHRLSDACVVKLPTVWRSWMFEAAIELLWLALRSAPAKSVRAFDWSSVVNQFAILFGATARQSTLNISEGRIRRSFEAEMVL